MYIVNMQYFEENGRYLGNGYMLSPGKDPRALREYIQKQDLREYCGIPPAYIYAVAETGEPLIVQTGGGQE